MPKICHCTSIKLVHICQSYHENKSSTFLPSTAYYSISIRVHQILKFDSIYTAD